MTSSLLSNLNPEQLAAVTLPHQSALILAGAGSGKTRVRLAAMTPVHTRGMWIGTFHGLCNRMLRAHYRDANLPQLFQIMDTQDQLSLIKRMYRVHNIDDVRYP